MPKVQPYCTVWRPAKSDLQALFHTKALTATTNALGFPSSGAVRVKVEVAVLGFLSLIARTVSVDSKATFEEGGLVQSSGAV